MGQSRQVIRMNVGHGWRATFIDETKGVVLSKPGSTRSRIYLLYNFPFLKRIDPVTGLRKVDGFDIIPPDTRATLMEVCKERWGVTNEQ